VPVEYRRATVGIDSGSIDSGSTDSGSTDSGSTDSGDTVRLTAWVEGFVQGVGFRWWTRSRALELGLVGSARNLTDGRVAVVAEGDRAACEALLAALRGGSAPGAVRQVVEQWTEARGDLRGFVEG
jgi:acylphosphatase